MTRLFLTAAISVWAATGALAQDLGGTYAVAGTNPNGSPYGGEATITLTSQSTCEIVWTTGPTSSSGICMRNGNAFAAGYSLGDAVGLIIYEVMPDGTMNGLWTVAGQDGVGTEILTPL